MDPKQRYLEEQLQRRESEASELRGNLRELGTKFFQLERAFEINLQSQTSREVEFNRMKLKSGELQKLLDEAARARTELNSRLMNAITERDHWKNAFLQQRDIIKRNKLECDNAVAAVKRDCENILKMARETAEKESREIVEQRRKAEETVTRLKERIKTYEGSKREHENRSFELANLLETLKRLDVDVSSVCQLAAETLKNLTEPGNLFEESMRNLRHLAWTVKDEKDEPQLVLLREQNSVLREVVKNLKRKMREQTYDAIPEREHKPALMQTETNSLNINQLNVPNAPRTDENSAPMMENTRNSLIPRNNDDLDTEKREAHDNIGARATNGARGIRYEKFKIDGATVDKCGKILYIQSHSNGVAYEEYVFKLSIDREIKIKYPVLLNNNESVVKLEFVDDEANYENTPTDRMLILFKNIYAMVNIKQTGVPCSTQTTKMKTRNSFAQTALAGVNSFSRLNIGVTMLNSEKRAIERSLCNLERTVKTLKFNALNQAENMIGKHSHLFKNDEMLDYIKMLS